MFVEVHHTGGFEFAVKSGPHTITFDAKSPIGKDHGPTPKEVLLGAILGCSGMDVAGLLKKYKMQPDEFSMTAEAAPRDQHPKIFPRIDVCFRFRGAALDAEKIKEAVDLSMTRYCGVSAMICATSPIHYVIEINGAVTAKGLAAF